MRVEYIRAVRKRPTKRTLAARARSRKGCAWASEDTTLERVRELVGFVREGLYSKTRAVTLAKAWGISVSRVEQLAAEAHRHVKLMESRARVSIR